MRFLFHIIPLLCLLNSTITSGESNFDAFPFSHHESLHLSLLRHNERHTNLNQEPNDCIDLSQFDPVLSAESEPLTTVGGCVNIVSGHFFQIERDLKGTSIEPLHIIRFYDSGNENESSLGFGFGSQFPLWASDIQESDNHSYGMISEREGFLIPYRGKSEFDHHGKKICLIDPRLKEKGLTNLCRSVLNGHSNFVNWKAIYRSKGNSEAEWILQLGDGSKRIYSKSVKIEKEHQIRMNFPTRKAYLLSKEIKPNGNQLLFSYSFIHEKPRLTHIKTMNRTSTAILDELKFNYSSDGCSVTNSNGDTVHYIQSEEPCLSKHFSLGKQSNRKVLKKVETSQKGNITYKTMKEKGNRKITKVEKPHRRFIEINYEEATRRGDEDRVLSIIEPLGPNGEKVKSYQFHYQKDATLVKDALGHLKVYRFDTHQRLFGIDHFDKHHHLVRQEDFEWSKLEGQRGWLQAKLIRLGNQISHLKTYRYDSHGNIIRTTLYGNLTGQKSDSFTMHEKKAVDHTCINYTYTNDERNLLKEICTPEGWRVIYDYLPNTNLCTKILHHYNGKIQERFFYTYDENGQLTKAIEDDGSGDEESDLSETTYRKMRIIESIKTPGIAFGKPQQETLCYQDSRGEIISLKRTEFFYDDKGREVKQRVYDSQNIFCFELTKDYDSRGRLIQESNALGHSTQYAYDDNNNKTKEVLIGSGKKTYYNYDLANRLIRKIEKHENGEVFTTSYSYNVLNQLISEIDPYNNAITYSYDSFGNQTQCIQPLMQEAQGTFIHPVISRTYNLLDQMITQTDEKGLTTHFTYNIYGSPTRITHPDGSIERFIYYPNGWLKQKWKADGTSTHYTYDPKGRLLKETTYDQNESLLKEEEYGYKGPLLQYKKDAMGLVISYIYDGAGRKIKEKIGQFKTIHTEYDDFDRVIKIQNEDQQEIFQYDWLNRVLSKTLQNSQGHIYAKEAYVYDILGNQIQKSIWQNDDQIAVYHSHYHSDGTLSWQEDPLGNRTTWQYNHHHTNGFGQCVQCRAMIDPLGRPIREADDAYHRIVRKDFYEGEHQLSCTHFDYDAAGNLAKIHSLVMAEGQPIREYWITKSYNTRGLLETEIEMPQGKTTSYAYDHNGRLIRKEKPDGVTLHYAYDGLGRLQELKSSDGTIAYNYTYDLHDNVIQIDDLVHARVQKRRYDLLDRLIEEELSPGMNMCYTYDTHDRMTQMTLPDGSFVAYTYNPFHLVKIQRFNSSGELAYEIECQYDKTGNLLKRCSPAGTITYSYDLLGRAVNIKSNHWKSHLEQFDPVGNLLKMTQKDPSGTLNSQFTYDRFNHLTHESPKESRYTYDSIGNCLKKNDQQYNVNALNQLLNDGESDYTYDSNGNLKTQSHPKVTYTYDALNRMIRCEKEECETTFLYDAFGRCLQISDGSKTQKLLYQGDQEIGSLVNGKMQEFRLIHPEPKLNEHTFAIELQKESFFPIQDFCGNICALQRKDGTLAQWMRYSAFGTKSIDSNQNKIIYNPWGYANRREVVDLSLFTHRFYNPRLMRWQTTDPLGFEDGLNLYSYVHNNPFYYRDRDGRFALALPLVGWTFGVALSPVILPTMAVIGTATLAYSFYQLATYIDGRYNQVEVDEQDQIEIKEEKKGRKRGNDNAIKGGPPRDPKTGNYLPDPAAEGTPHTTLGIKKGTHGPYVQGATFNEKGKFKGRTDVTDHNRHDHHKPHFHPETGPNSANSPPQPIRDFF